MRHIDTCSNDELKSLLQKQSYLMIEWENCVVANMLADYVVAVTLRMQRSLNKVEQPMSARVTALQVGDFHTASITESHILAHILTWHLGSQCYVYEAQLSIMLIVDGIPAFI